MNTGTETALRIKPLNYNVNCQIKKPRVLFRCSQCSVLSQLKCKTNELLVIRSRYGTGIWKIPIERYRSLWSKIDMLRVSQGSPEAL